MLLHCCTSHVHAYRAVKLFDTIIPSCSLMRSLTSLIYKKLHFYSVSNSCNVKYVSSINLNPSVHAVHHVALHRCFDQVINNTAFFIISSLIKHCYLTVFAMLNQRFLYSNNIFSHPRA